MNPNNPIELLLKGDICGNKEQKWFQHLIFNNQNTHEPHQILPHYFNYIPQISINGQA